jgi:hypothetical protein
VQFERWTGETAQGYGTCMFKPTLLIPLFFLLGVGVGCKDDEPTGAQFGEACGRDESEPDCAEGSDSVRRGTARNSVCEQDSDCPSRSTGFIVMSARRYGRMYHPLMPRNDTVSRSCPSKPRHAAAVKCGVSHVSVRLMIIDPNNRLFRPVSLIVFLSPYPG